MEINIGGYDVWPYVEFLALGLTLLLVWLFATNIVIGFKSIYNKHRVGKKLLIASCLSFTLLFTLNILTSTIMALVIESTVIGLYSLTVFSTWGSMTVMSIIVTIVAIRKEKAKKEAEDSLETTQSDITESAAETNPVDDADSLSAPPPKLSL